MGRGSGTASPVAVILVLVAIVVAVVLWQKVMDAGRRKATQGIMRGTHARGQAAVRTSLAFTVPSARAAVIEKIVTTVNAYPMPPALVGGLYLKTRTADGLVFGFGSKVGDSFVVRVAVTELEEGGVRGTAVVPAWTERDGLVDAIEQIERLTARVEAAIGELGGTVERVPVRT